jgi:hypothetical protein
LFFEFNIPHNIINHVYIVQHMLISNEYLDILPLIVVFLPQSNLLEEGSNEMRESFHKLAGYGRRACLTLSMTLVALVTILNPLILTYKAEAAPADDLEVALVEQCKVLLPEYICTQLVSDTKDALSQVNREAALAVITRVSQEIRSYAEGLVEQVVTGELAVEDVDDAVKAKIDELIDRAGNEVYDYVYPIVYKAAYDETYNALYNFDYDSTYNSILAGLLSGTEDCTQYEYQFTEADAEYDAIDKAAADAVVADCEATNQAIVDANTNVNIAQSALDGLQSALNTAQANKQTAIDILVNGVAAVRDGIQSQLNGYNDAVDYLNTHNCSGAFQCLSQKVTKATVDGLGGPAALQQAIDDYNNNQLNPASPSYIGNTVDASYQQAIDAAQQALNDQQATLDALKDALANTEQSAEDRAKAITDYLQDLAEAAAKAAADTAATAAAESIAGGIEASVESALKSIRDEIYGYIEDVVNQVTDAIDKAVDNIRQEIKNALDQAKAAVDAARQAIEDAADKVSQELIDAYNRAVDEYNKIVNRIAEFYDDAKNFVLDTVKDINDIANIIRDNADKIAGFVDDAIDYITSGNFADDIRDILEQIKNRADSYIQSHCAIVKDALTQVGAEASKLEGKIPAQLYALLQQGLSAAWNYVNNLCPDADQDGVIDNQGDLCPNTPNGETVDSNGCSDSQKDDDNDGVNNAIDKCPNEAGTLANNGCPAGGGGTVTPVVPDSPSGVAPAPVGGWGAASDDLAVAETTDTDSTDSAATSDTNTANDEENGEVKGTQDENRWSVANLVLAIATTLTSVVVLFGLLSTDRKNNRTWLRVATIVPAVAAVVAFFLTEDWSLPVAFVDSWTILMLVILAAQIALTVFAVRKAED